MTKNLHEPSTPREVAANRYSGKLTQQRPYAYQWVTPVNVADCPADPYSLTDPRPAWTPCYLNDWERPTTLEPLSVRLSADGTLQWQGYVNSANATAAIAFIMPGTLSGEPDMIPDVSVGENLSYNVFVTPDDGTTVLNGRAYVDSTTGEVTITATVAPGITRAYMFKDTSQTISTASTTNITGYDAGGSTVDDTGFTTDETNGKFEIETPGIFLVQGVILWATSFNFGKMARIQISGGNVIQDTNSWTQWVSEEDTGTNVDQVTVEALLFVDSVSTDVLVQLAVRQLSGSNKDISTVDFSIVRLGAY